jgi:muramidase (phage lysozyme)
MRPNLQAFLDTIAVSELGPDLLAESDNGYNVIVGSRPSRADLFDSYADHPRKLVRLIIRGKIIESTAAGRYQILERYYDHYRMSLGLPDFSPESQDAIAIQLIRECRAIGDIEAGNFDAAVTKCSSRWASLPMAGYGQHENDMGDLRAAFVAAGGTLA